MTAPEPTWVLLHAGALGDLVLTLQLARTVRAIAAAREWLVVSRVDPGDLSRHVAGLRRRSLEGLGAHWLYADADAPAPPPLAALIAGRRVLSALGDATSLVHRRLMRLRPSAVFSFDPRPRPGLRTHVTDQWRAELERQGLSLDQPRVPDARRAPLPPRIAAAAPRPANPAPDAPRPIVLAPGAGSPAKCWPLSNYVELARLLVRSAERSASRAPRREAGGEARRAAPSPCVTFLLGPAERDRWPPESRGALPADCAVIECPTPDGLVGLLESAAAYVGNDAGPSHLAALVGTATVVIFGPTSARVWRPLGVAVEVFQGRPQADPAAWGVTPHAVAARVRRLLRSGSG